MKFFEVRIIFIGIKFISRSWLVKCTFILMKTNADGFYYWSTCYTSIFFKNWYMYFNVWLISFIEFSYTNVSKTCIWEEKRSILQKFVDEKFNCIIILLFLRWSYTLDFQYGFFHPFNSNLWEKTILHTSVYSWPMVFTRNMLLDNALDLMIL